MFDIQFLVPIVVMLLLICLCLLFAFADEDLLPQHPIISDHVHVRLSPLIIFLIICCVFTKHHLQKQTAAGYNSCVTEHTQHTGPDQSYILIQACAQFAW